MFGIKELSIDFLTGQPFFTALIFILFVLFAVYIYRRTNPPLSTGMKILLTGLRLTAIIAVFLALFEPVISYRREYERKPKLTVLIDKSASMENVEAGKSRAERADSLLSSNLFAEIKDAFEYKVEPFAGQLLSGSGSQNLDITAIGEVIGELSNKEIAAPSEAWLLISDGISNSGVAPAEAALRARSPIYSIGIGMETGEKDVAITGLDYNQVVFAGKPTVVTVHLEWQGMKNERANIEIKSGRRTLTGETISLPAGNLRHEVQLKMTPERPGQQTFTVNIQGLNNELSTENNSRSFSMTVLKSKLNVLLVADHPDWEYAFLKRFLSRSESIELTEVIFKKGGGYLSGSFPNSQADLNRNDLIILYDVDMQSLKARKALFDSFIKDRGGSMLVILGENYLKDRFPRWLDDFLPFINSRGGRGPAYVAFNGSPMENYLFHPAVRIADNRQAIREAWQSLPHFEVLIPTDSIPPNSEILVTSGLGAEGADPPVIGVRNFGAGRVMATAALPFWHWGFFGYGFGGDDKEYRQLLDGVINWLSVRSESDPIRIVPDKMVYTRGEIIGFNAFVFDLGFRPIPGASGYITLVGEGEGDSTMVQLVEKGEGLYRAEFDILSPGRYKYIGIVEKDGNIMKESSGQIALERYSIEEYQKRPDFGSLLSVSMLTGGKYFKCDEADSLSNVLTMDRVTVSLQKETILWNKFWILAVFVLSLAIEWLIRKRFQLI